MKEDLNKLRDMNKDDVNSQVNVVKSVEDEDDLFSRIRVIIVFIYNWIKTRSNMFKIFI